MDQLPEKDDDLKRVVVQKVKDFVADYGLYFKDQARKRGFPGNNFSSAMPKPYLPRMSTIWAYRRIWVTMGSGWLSAYLTITS